MGVDQSRLDPNILAICEKIRKEEAEKQAALLARYHSEEGKAYITNYIKTEPITNADCVSYWHSYKDVNCCPRGRNGNVWQYGPTGIGFSFSNHLPPLIKLFINNLLDCPNVHDTRYHSITVPEERTFHKMDSVPDLPYFDNSKKSNIWRGFIVGGQPLPGTKRYDRGHRVIQPTTAIQILLERKKGKNISLDAIFKTRQFTPEEIEAAEKAYREFLRNNWDGSW